MGTSLWALPNIKEVLITPPRLLGDEVTSRVIGSVRRERAVARCPNGRPASVIRFLFYKEVLPRLLSP
jgi:hypothetical protein